MTKNELMPYVGKKVHIYFKDKEKGIYGTLGYMGNFSANPNGCSSTYFFVNHSLFKASYVRKLEEK